MHLAQLTHAFIAGQGMAGGQSGPQILANPVPASLRCGGEGVETRRKAPNRRSIACVDAASFKYNSPS